MNQREAAPAGTRFFGVVTRRKVPCLKLIMFTMLMLSLAAFCALVGVSDSAYPLVLNCST